MSASFCMIANVWAVINVPILTNILRQSHGVIFGQFTAQRALFIRRGTNGRGLFFGPSPSKEFAIYFRAMSPERVT